MDHIRKWVYTSPMSGHDRVFNIDYTLGSGHIPVVLILDSECYEIWLQFQSNNADEFAYTTCVVNLNKCKLVFHTKEAKVKGFCEGLWCKG